MRTYPVTTFVAVVIRYSHDVTIYAEKPVIIKMHCLLHIPPAVCLPGTNFDTKKSLGIRCILPCYYILCVYLLFCILFNKWEKVSSILFFLKHFFLYVLILIFYKV